MVSLDPGAGYAAIGQLRVPLAHAGREGQLQLGGPAGPVLRPLRFGARSRAVWRALSCADPRTALCSELLHHAVEQPGETDLLVQQIVALVLAGADTDGPPLAQAALLVANASQMSLRELDEVDAIEVDRLAVQVHGQPQTDSEWHTLRFEPAPDDELANFRTAMCDRLLRRGMMSHAEPRQHRGTDAYGQERSAGTRPAPIGSTDAGLIQRTTDQDGVASEHGATQPLVDASGALPGADGRDTADLGGSFRLRRAEFAGQPRATDDASSSIPFSSAMSVPAIRAGPFAARKRTGSDSGLPAAVPVTDAGWRVSVPNTAQAAAFRTTGPVESARVDVGAREVASPSVPFAGNSTWNGPVQRAEVTPGSSPAVAPASVRATEDVAEELAQLLADEAVLRGVVL
jgi:hypothetical protein